MTHDRQAMDFDTQVKLNVYDTIASTAVVPTISAVAASVGATAADVRDAFRRLQEKRLLALFRDTGEIRMAPPFSAVPTPHLVHIGNRTYTANCIWDAFGIAAAFNRDAVIDTRSGGDGDPMQFEVLGGRPVEQPCVMHYAVPAARWWADVVFT
jgi:hypothetical protein